ncbi:UNVERIFIED_CONTAM: hypothetical protein RMT77_005091 [Armadillidium vulgare]
MQAWEPVLSDALHYIRSLLCTATNATPHERLFSFPRKTSLGLSIPSWLVEPGSVLLKKYVRCKDDPLVEEVQLLEANPQFAHVRFPNGREDTVSIRDLAPAPAPAPAPESASLRNSSDKSAMPSNDENLPVEIPHHNVTEEIGESNDEPAQDTSESAPNLCPEVRRPTRIRRPVNRLNL